MSRAPASDPPHTPSAAFPRTALQTHMAEQHMNELLGKGPAKNGHRDAGSMSPNTYLPWSFFPDKTYLVLGESQVPAAARIT